ncbi:MAG: G-D-S-L family lipolytic protein [Armatimonadetes bacterium Cent15-Ar3]|nr:MAG: G-D-S-L family lipolytic protein [Armatimonadetes bacterium Cent15-Ar3]
MLLAALFLGQVTPYVYQKELDAWREADAKNPPKPGMILFIGSSTFTNWKTVDKAFPSKNVLNRAYGGSGLGHLIRDYKVFTAYKPKQIAVYCGENDLAGGKTAAYAVFENFKKFFGLVRKELPTVDILYCAMKPSPSRWQLRAKYTYGNQLIKDFLATQPRADYISCWDAMLGSDGRPDPSIFGPDMLHMNAKGYAIWTRILEPKLK